VVQVFVQVIKGKTGDAAGLRRQLDRWVSDVRPGAIGFVGSTVGIADDGTFVAVARFEDEASAQANSSRSEQGAWWQDTVKYLDGEPTFRESSDTATLFDGGDDSAGFVQVMEGKVTDRAKADAMETPEMLDQLRSARPDLIGSFRVWFPDGAFVDVAYFTSEDEARKGEKSADFEGPEEEFTAVYGEMTYIDLKDPILTSA
jgi:hypothetical protein